MHTRHGGKSLIPTLMATVLVAAIAASTLTACGTRRLDDAKVTAFIDKADNAARKRFAPEICALRGKTFTAHQTFHAEGNRGEPAELTIDRKLFCSEAGKFSHLEQYVLERKSLEIKLAGDLKSADVNAVYTEKLPYYEVPPSTASDYRDVQVLETVDHSRVGIEDGDKDQTGTCYSVDVALTANFALAGGAVGRGRHQGTA
jgi:hypothetical protein